MSSKSEASIRASMLATLADIRSKDPTPGRIAAATNIVQGLAKMSEYAVKAPKGGGFARTVTFYDKEQLMRIADDLDRSGAERDRAKSILKRDGDLTKGDVQFLARSEGAN